MPGSVKTIGQHMAEGYFEFTFKHTRHMLQLFTVAIFDSTEVFVKVPM